MNKKPTKIQEKKSLETRFNAFMQSLGELFIEMTALEVNTMVVEEITADKFIPWEVYRDLFPICQEYLQKQPISPNLYHRYLELRKQLELQYLLLLTNPNSEIYDQQNTIDEINNNSILSDHNLEINPNNTYLPNPFNSKSNQAQMKVQNLLNCSAFLRILRKIGENKITLDRRNRLLLTQSESNVCTNTIYAQTILQLDGDVINRFNQNILAHPQQNLLIKLHQESVNAGQKQWQGLLNFMIQIIQKIK